jgi:hypothetical protein
MGHCIIYCINECIVAGFVQCLNPACRAARFSAGLPVGRFLLLLSDLDLGHPQIRMGYAAGLVGLSNRCGEAGARGALRLGALAIMLAGLGLWVVSPWGVLAGGFISRPTGSPGWGRGPSSNLQYSTDPKALGGVFLLMHPRPWASRDRASRSIRAPLKGRYTLSWARRSCSSCQGAVELRGSEKNGSGYGGSEGDSGEEYGAGEGSLLWKRWGLEEGLWGSWEGFGEG